MKVKTGLTSPGQAGGVVIITLELPVTLETGEFGSAPPEFWEHADFSHAWVDGKLCPADQYLHVPCHNTEDCERCHEMDWQGTVHRFWPRIGTNTLNLIGTVRIGPMKFDVRKVRVLKTPDDCDSGWSWRITAEKRP